VDQVAALRELAGFLALAADGILVWGGGRVTRTTTTSAMRPWAGPPNDRFSSPVTRKPVVKHAIAAVAPKSTRVEHAHGWLPGRVAGPFGHHADLGKPPVTRRGTE
jgi:hypothetical protein